jgi:hypothetical protein
MNRRSAVGDRAASTRPTATQNPMSTAATMTADSAMVPPTHDGRNGSSQGTGATMTRSEAYSRFFPATTMAVVSAAGTPSRRLSVHTRRTSPARAGAMADAAFAAIS